MKKFVLFFPALAFAVAASAQVCNPNPPDPNATQPGFNPNPFPTAYEGVNYNHQNTIVIPDSLENPLQPGTMIALCGIKILSVDVDTAASFNGTVPSGFNWNYEVWQGNTQIQDSTDVITVNSLTRLCARFVINNPPAPVNNPCDTIYFKILVRGRLDLDGPGPLPCIDVQGNSGVATFFVAQPLCPASFASNEDHILQGFTLKGNVPNPASENTIIYFNMPQNGEVVLNVTDALGRIVMTENLVAQDGSNAIPVSTVSLSSGLYTYSLQFKGKTLSSKMMIQK